MEAPKIHLSRRCVECPNCWRKTYLMGEGCPKCHVLDDEAALRQIEGPDPSLLEELEKTSERTD